MNLFMMNANPHISILIPVYNVKDFILRCLESVISQTYTGPLECLIVDDCGNDGSIALVEDYLARYDGHIDFRILHHECNRGLAAARNTAVENATGDFIFHLDSDDWLEPTAIEHLVLKQQETDADIVSGQAIEHTQKGISILNDSDYKTPRDMVYSMIEMTIVHVIWRRLIRRSLYVDNSIKAVEGVNVGEDYCTIPKLAYFAQNVSTLNEVVYHYNCLNPNSYMSSGFSIKRFRSDLSSIEILQNFFSDKDEYCVNRLKEIKKSFLDSSMRMAAITNNIEAYKEAVSIYGPISHGFGYWTTAWIIRMKDKLKKEIKRLLRR